MQRHGPIILMFAAASCGGLASVGDPTKSELTVAGQKISVEDARTLRVVLRDPAGTPIGNANVAWEVTGSTNHVIPVENFTDAQGVAEAWYSTMTAEDKTVRVHAGGVTLSRAFHVDPGRPGLYTSVALEPTCAIADGETVQTIVVRARDLYANATPGETVGIRLLHAGPQVLDGMQSRADLAGVARIRVISNVAGRFPFALTLGQHAILRELCFY